MSAFDSGADQIGLNFYSKSVRNISLEKAQQLVDSLPKRLETVGVFVNETIETVLATAAQVGLDGIQLHGDEDPNYVHVLAKQTDRFIIKAFRVLPSFKVKDALDWKVTHQLFDTYSPSDRGGTGETFDWKVIAADMHECFPVSAYLAGGLTPDNLAEAVGIVRPYAVDVASGVESSPGKKDHRKVASFIKAAKEAI